MEQVRVWQVNSLPIPFETPFEEGAAAVAVPLDIVPPEIDIDDNFPKGVVQRYFSNREQGIIKSRSGHEIEFKLTEMEFVGSKGKESLSEGVPVGYDLARAGKSLHVKKLKIY